MGVDFGSIRRVAAAVLALAHGALALTLAEARSAVRFADMALVSKLELSLTPAPIEHAAGPEFDGSVRVFADPGEGAEQRVGWCSVLDAADGEAAVSALKLVCGRRRQTNVSNVLERTFQPFLKSVGNRSDSNFPKARNSTWKSGITRLPRCGPLCEPPHLFCRVAVTEAELEVWLEFVPRADAGYDLENADGEYPEPASRAQFEQRSRRAEFAARWFTNELRSEVCFEDDAAASGPICVARRVPLATDALETALRLRQFALETALRWLCDAEPVSQTKSQLLFAHDCRALRSADAQYASGVAKAFPALSGAADGTLRGLVQAALGPADMVDRSAAMCAAAADHNFAEFGLGEMRRMVDD